MTLTSHQALSESKRGGGVRLHAPKESGPRDELPEQLKPFLEAIAELATEYIRAELAISNKTYLNKPASPGLPLRIDLITLSPAGIAVRHHPSAAGQNRFLGELSKILVITFV